MSKGKEYRHRGGGRTFPLMLVPVAAVSASGFLLDKQLGSANIEYLKTGNLPALLEGMLKSSIVAKNYTPLVTSVLLYVVARKLFGKVRLTKKLSLL